MELDNFSIENFLSLNKYEENRKDRRKGSKGTQEFFTPYSIVKSMADKISDSDWTDYTKRFLEPSFGNGQFLIYMIYKRLTLGVDWKTILENLYGVELMEDNVRECKERVLDLLDKLKIKYDKDIAMEIMNKNLICHDFFTWNFEEWRPMTDEEIKKSRKK